MSINEPFVSTPSIISDNRNSTFSQTCIKNKSIDNFKVVHYAYIDNLSGTYILDVYKRQDYTGALINISIFLKLGLTILGNLISGVNPQDAIILSVDSVIFGNEQPVTSEQLQEAGFKDTSEKSVAGLNTTLITNNIRPVSYTHLDVYKRQR